MWLWLLAVDALACSCVTGLTESLPVDGQTGVAVDAAPLLVFNLDPGPVALIDSETGEEVPTEVQSAGQGDHTVLRLVPAAPLLSNHAYRIDGTDPYGLVPFPEFTTGSSPDVDAPGGVALRDVGGGYWPSNSCGDAVYLIPEASPAAPDAFYELTLSWDEAFEDAVVVTGVTPPLAGWGFCGSNVPELEKGQEVWLRLRAVDLSGNASPWSEPTHVPSIQRADSATGCGCNGSGGPAPWSLLALLALMRLRRR